MSDNAAQNGSSTFVVDDLLNMIVPFEFPFEGSVLKGKWFKYRTHTPSYVKNTMAQIRELQERFVSLTTQVKESPLDDTETSRLLEERDQIDAQLQRTAFDWMKDAIVEWNAVKVALVCPGDPAHTGVVQEDGAVARCAECPSILEKKSEVLPISRETLDTFPLVFLGKLNDFFSNERMGQNPTSPTS